MTRGALAGTAMLGCAMALSGCGDSKTASKQNFATALDKHYQSHCIFITPSVGVSTFPVTVQGDTEHSQYDALVSAGLLDQNGKTLQQPGPLGIGTQTVTQNTYALTAKGKSVFQQGHDASDTGFCAGHYPVDQITSFTQPAPDNGQTVSNVHYTLKPVMSDWAMNPSVQSRYGQELSKVTGVSDQATLVLANDGWTVAGAP